METKVYVSPNDILSGLAKALTNPMVWVYFLGFPFFLVRYRLRHRRKKQA
jgi:threonine/homoserine/homoserine lactone efflux protein